MLREAHAWNWIWPKSGIRIVRGGGQGTGDGVLFEIKFLPGLQ